MLCRISCCLGIALTTICLVPTRAAAAITIPTPSEFEARARVAPIQCVPRDSGKPSLAIWDSLAALEYESKWAAAETLASATIERLERAPRVDSLQLSRALIHRASARLKHRVYGDGSGFATLDRALSIRERNVRGFDRLSVWAHVVASIAYGDGERPAPGALHARAALHGLESAPADSALLAFAHYGLGLCSEGDEARRHFQVALELQTDMLGAHHPALVLTLVNYATSRTLSYDYDGGRDMLMRAESIAREDSAAGFASLESVLRARSTWESRIGDLAAAIDYAQRAYELVRHRVGSSHGAAVRTKRVVANRLVQIGDYHGAAAIYGEILPGIRAALGPGSVGTVNVHLSLVDALIRIGSIEAATRELEAAQVEPANAPGSDPTNIVFFLQVAADLENARGRLEAARDSLRRANAIEWKAGGRTGGRRAILYRHWLETIKSPVDRAALEEVNREIQRLADSTVVRRGALWPPVVWARTAAEARVGLRDLAWRRALDGDSLARVLRSEVLSSLPEAHALQVARAIRDPADLLVALARPDHPEEIAAAWDRIMNWRGVVRRELARRRLPAGTSDTALVAAHGRWIAARRRLAQLVVSGAAHPDDPQTAELFQSAKRTAEVTEFDYTKIANVRAPAADSVALQAVLGRLQPSQALVSFAAGSIGPGTEKLGAFVATGAERRPRWVEIGPTSEVENEVRAWVRSLSTPATGRREEEACRRLGDIVRRRVWDPIVATLEGATDLFVVPEGVLTEVPWLALPGPRRSYLAEGGFVIRVLDAERDLSSPRETARGAGILAIGAPDFDRVEGDRALAESRLPRGNAAALALSYHAQQWPCREAPRLAALPGARAEVDAIVAAWPGSEGPARVLSGAEAAEAAVKREAPGHAVLHIATHGIVVSDSCQAEVEGTRGVGGITTIESEKTGSAARKKPPASATAPGASAARIALRRESVWSERQVWLALAGANRPPDASRGADEGLLTAEEIATLDLRGTSWVVLSACHSGLANAWAREGVLGMGRAFLLAGADAVIAARWPIGDETTREWMSHLYAARGRGLSAGEAVTAATRSALAARRKDGRPTHPFHWAAFTSNGE